MKIREIRAKSVLSKSKVSPYTINPYIGCEYNCTYCYARFIKKFSPHKEPWGEFVDVKINAGEVLEKEIKKSRVGRVWISGICDPYQPVEEKYGVTRKCLEVLSKNNWPVSIQTKSPLVLRDLELLKKFKRIEVTFTITTADEKTRQIFEPTSPSIKERIGALERLHEMGIITCAMIAPILPNSEGLVKQLSRNVDYVIIDKMNYHYADWVYRKYNLEYAMDDDFFNKTKKKLVELFKKEEICSKVLF